MAIRCRYCNTLIIHRFRGNYNRMDSRRKQRHERICKSNPEVIKRTLKVDIIKANHNATNLKRFADFHIKAANVGKDIATIAKLLLEYIEEKDND